MQKKSSFFFSFPSDSIFGKANDLAKSKRCKHRATKIRAQNKGISSFFCRDKEVSLSIAKNFELE
jgi:hypothetical protein